MIIILHFLLSTFFFNDSSYLFKSTKFVLILHIVFYIDENIETWHNPGELLSFTNEPEMHQS